MSLLKDLMKEKNIHALRTYTIGDNSVIIAPNVIGYAFEDGNWVIYDVDERCHKVIYKRFDTEEEAVRELFRLIEAFHFIGR